MAKANLEKTGRNIKQLLAQMPDDEVGHLNLYQAYHRERSRQQLIETEQNSTYATGLASLLTSLPNPHNHHALLHVVYGFLSTTVETSAFEYLYENSSHFTISRWLLLISLLTSRPLPIVTFTPIEMLYLPIALLQIKCLDGKIANNDAYMYSIGHAAAASGGLSLNECQALHPGELLLWRLGFHAPQGQDRLNERCLTSLIEDPNLHGSLLVLESLLHCSQIGKHINGVTYYTFDDWQPDMFDFSRVPRRSVTGEALVKRLAACLFSQSNEPASWLLDLPLNTLFLKIYGLITPAYGGLIDDHLKDAGDPLSMHLAAIHCCKLNDLRELSHNQRVGILIGWTNQQVKDHPPTKWQLRAVLEHGMRSDILASLDEAGAERAVHKHYSVN